nr:MAG TPA: hypothetical protein [Caudoviricetes sp.]
MNLTGSLRQNKNRKKSKFNYTKTAGICLRFFCLSESSFRIKKIMIFSRIDK